MSRRELGGSGTGGAVGPNWFLRFSSRDSAAAAAVAARKGIAARWLAGCWDHWGPSSGCAAPEK